MNTKRNGLKRLKCRREMQVPENRYLNGGKWGLNGVDGAIVRIRYIQDVQMEGGGLGYAFSLVET